MRSDFPSEENLGPDVGLYLAYQSNMMPRSDIILREIKPYHPLFRSILAGRGTVITIISFEVLHEHISNVIPVSNGADRADENGLLSQKPPTVCGRSTGAGSEGIGVPHA